ncbi:Ornithine cyclodeaminase/mu-crystallin [Penicillium cf. griseofulvum]|uniref:Ornithine cyclodeaminase/mu-crystallin n=1 Tax=Penicillium cf. griseofulvum TaxID=2972120 RepID=A0A9W9MSY9_9EURO|nr:Ornithine cyclodeaminase/mu-crystallin [Penicillium cf. griseofulvum]KAJ5446488.1 Ornithine cyclodeaminase/mu-crystallin [Penicillium cf. griseofulvum]KAJ5448229.1 Ornithine cyclodeaminase/mu-crystallin [Penicillium cf. griseofulvum]
MPLTIISRSQLRELLHALSRDEIQNLQRNLAEALREYSSGSQEKGCSATYQPQRTAITRQNGRTTLFMPASTGQTIGIKMISLQDGGDAGCAIERDNLDTQEKEQIASRRGGSFRNSVASLSSELSDLSVGSEEDKEDSNSISPVTTANESSTAGSSMESSTLLTGCVNQQNVTSNISKTLGAWPGAGTRDTSPRGCVTLLDGESLPFALINAHELTAFRTALASLMMFNRRKKVRTILVFGAGTQAYWHIRLALVLRGEDIRRVIIVNRSFDRASKLLQEIYQPENAEWRGDVKFSAVSTDFGEYSRILKTHVRKADAIFCCTPSVEPLFPAEYLTSGEGRQKGRLICAIGSYKAHMTEIHPDILRDEVNIQSAHRHWHKHIHRSGVIVVDSLDAAMKEAGEIIQAGIKPKQVVELGELLMVRDATRDAATVDDEKSLREWSQRGNVIYKSVGLGLMDLVTGGDLVRLARERKLGTTVEDF